MNKKLIYLFAMLLTAATALAQRVDNTLNTMTYNIRLNAESDGENQWKYRKDFAANLIKFYDVDVFGSQEVLHDQLEDLLQRLPGYDYVGVGRADGKTKGEYSPIIYRKDRLEVVKSGNFWLAEDINAVGKKGWDADYERVATWAILKDKQTGKKFLFFNTHLDNTGKIARREGARLILKQTKLLSENLPIIVTGDFNALPSDEPIKLLTDSSKPMYLIHTRDVAPLRYGPEWTFHDFGRLPLEKREWLDYIFIKGNIKVVKHGVLAEQLNNLYPSDHCPVIATLKLMD